MLGTMKKLMKSFLGGIVLLIIIVGMAVWGIEDIFRGDLGGSMVEAGSRNLTNDAFDRRVENVLRNLNADSDKPISKAEATEQGIVDQVFSLEVSKVVNLGYASEIGAIAPEPAVISRLQEETAFANPLTGEFDLSTYRQVLQRNQMTPKIYQQQVEDELSIALLRQGASGAISPPDVLNTLQASYIGETRDVSFFILDGGTLEAPNAPDEETLENFYGENLAIFKQPERRGIDLLKLSTSDFISQVEVTDDEVSRIYEATKAQRFSEPDTRTISTLTFADRETARTALGMLSGGRPVESIDTASERSTQSGTRADFADELVAEALFGDGRSVGALFGPRQDADGNWELLRVDEIEPGTVYPLEAVSTVIRDELARERAEVLFFDALNTLDSAIGAGFELKEIGAEVGAPVISFAPVDANGFTQSGIALRGLIEAQDAFTSAFDYEVGELSDRFDSDVAVYLSTARTIIPEATPDFADIRDNVLAYYETTKSSESLAAAAAEIQAQIESGSLTLESAASEAGAELVSVQPAITRLTGNQSGLPGAAVSGVFAAQEGDVLTYPSRLGDQILIVQLNRITRPESADLEALKSSASASLGQSLDADLQAALEGEIRASLEARTNASAFEAYKTSLTTEQ